MCVAETVKLSRNVRAHIASRPLRPTRLDILTTGTDRGVNNLLTAELAKAWSLQKSVAVSIFEFPESAGIPHDMIDPSQPRANPKLVYAKLLKILRVE